MAKFAPVAPLPILQKLSDAGVLGNYHLLLAHDVVKHPREYERLFKRDDMYIIMDNSLIELGYPVDASVMADACHIVGADVAVLPDKLGDSEETVRLIHDCIREWSDIVPCRFQAVVQGTRMYEIQKCFKGIKELDEPGNIAGWSVPKVIQKHMSTRYAVIGYLVTHGIKKIHLLGFSDDLGDDIWCCNGFKEVKGIDSAVPIRMGTQCVIMDKAHPAHSPRGNWMETATDICEEVFTNLQLTRLWMEGIER